MTTPRFHSLLAFAAIPLFLLGAKSATAQDALLNSGFGDDAFLRANGTTLRDHKGDGEPVQLRGVNLGGWLEWQEWMCPMDSSGQARDENPGHNGYDFEVRHLLAKRFGQAEAEDLINTYEDAWITTRDLDNIKALKMNVVRLTFGYDTLMNDDGSWRDDAFKRMDWLVQNAWQRGIYTVIDYHAFLPESAAQQGSATGYWANRAQQDETVQIWTKIAQHFQGNPAVAMYDLLNEPNNSAPKGTQEPSAATVCALYDRLYHAIRSADPDHAIAMEGLWDWRSLRDPRRAGYQNVVCSLHWYHFGQNGTADNNSKTDDDLRNAAAMEQQWRIPCFIGEFNLFGDSAAWQYALRGYNQAKLSWAAWTYKNKAEGDNSWGVYTRIPGSAVEEPNLAVDSAPDIRRKWREWETNDRTFALNPMLGPVLKQ